MTEQEKRRVERYGALEKKRRAIEQDFERVRLKNKVNELKKTRKMLMARKLQMQRDYTGKQELAIMS